MLLFQRTQDQYPVSTKYLTTTCTQVSETLTLPSGIHKYCMYVVHRHTCRQEANTHKMYLKRIILNQNIYKGCLLDIHETLSSFNSQNISSLPQIYLLIFRDEILCLPGNKFLKNRIRSLWLNYYILSLTISCLPSNLPSKYTLPFYLGLYRRFPLHLGSLCAALHLSMQEGKSRYKAKKVKSIVISLSLKSLCNSDLIF